MTRTEKAAFRIQRLEREYLSILRDALVLDDGPESLFSSLVWRRRPIDRSGRISYDRFEKLSDEIETLRRKAGDIVPGTALKVLADFDRQFSALGTKQRPNDWNHRKRVALREIESQMASADSTKIPK